MMEAVVTKSSITFCHEPDTWENFSIFLLITKEISPTERNISPTKETANIIFTLMLIIFYPLFIFSFHFFILFQAKFSVLLALLCQLEQYGQEVFLLFPFFFRGFS
jgi:uncharacterized membrane protein (GlpM family)